MQVVVDQMPADPVKPPPSKVPSWLQSNRNKALAGLGLLTLIAVPAIVAPVVVSQQHKQQQQRASTVSPGDQSQEQMALSARDRAGEDSDPDDFVMVEANNRTRPLTTRFNATKFNATRFNDTRVTRTRNNTRLKVPIRSWTAANRTRASLTRPETWSPYVKIKDGQVR